MRLIPVALAIAFVLFGPVAGVPAWAQTAMPTVASDALTPGLQPIQSTPQPTRQETLTAAAAGTGNSLATFPTEQAAKAHCPADTVVWLNLPTGIYHFAGERWYGNTKNGAYACQKEADKAGDRATRNGQ